MRSNWTDDEVKQLKFFVERYPQNINEATRQFIRVNESNRTHAAVNTKIYRSILNVKTSPCLVTISKSKTLNNRKVIRGEVKAIRTPNRIFLAIQKFINNIKKR